MVALVSMVSLVAIISMILISPQVLGRHSGVDSGLKFEVHAKSAHTRDHAGST